MPYPSNGLASEQIGHRAEVASSQAASRAGGNANNGSSHCRLTVGELPTYSPRPGTPGRGARGEGESREIQPLSADPSPRSTGVRGE